MTLTSEVLPEPELPTMAEAGVAGFAVDPWFAMIAPRALPEASRAPLSALLARLLADPATAERLSRIGAEPMRGDADSLARLLAEEGERWGAFIRRTGIRAD